MKLLSFFDAENHNDDAELDGKEVAVVVVVVEDESPGVFAGAVDDIVCRLGVTREVGFISIGRLGSLLSFHLEDVIATLFDRMLLLRVFSSVAR